MNCPNCQTSNLDNATICINCGRSLSPAPPAPPLAQSYTPPPPPTSPSYGSGSAGSQMGGPAVPNYLIQSILVTFCCCLPFGIIAIIFAAQVNSKLAAGDHAGALESSRKAKMWTLIALGTGVLVWIIMGTVWGAAIAQAIREAQYNS